MEVMAHRSDRHAKNLVSGKVFETAGLMRLACAEPIRARERKHSQREAGYMSAIDLPITKVHPRIGGADHTYH